MCGHGRSRAALAHASDMAGSRAHRPAAPCPGGLSRTHTTHGGTYRGSRRSRRSRQAAWRSTKSGQVIVVGWSGSSSSGAGVRKSSRTSAPNAAPARATSARPSNSDLGRKPPMEARITCGSSSSRIGRGRRPWAPSTAHCIPVDIVCWREKGCQCRLACATHRRRCVPSVNPSEYFGHCQARPGTLRGAATAFGWVVRTLIDARMWPTAPQSEQKPPKRHSNGRTTRGDSLGVPKQSERRRRPARAAPRPAAARPGAKAGSANCPGVSKRGRPPRRGFRLEGVRAWPSDRSMCMISPNSFGVKA